MQKKRGATAFEDDIWQKLAQETSPGKLSNFPLSFFTQLLLVIEFGTFDELLENSSQFDFRMQIQFVF